MAQQVIDEVIAREELGLPHAGPFIGGPYDGYFGGFPALQFLAPDMTVTMPMAGGEWYSYVLCLSVRTSKKEPLTESRALVMVGEDVTPQYLGEELEAGMAETASRMRILRDDGWEDLPHTMERH